MTPTLLIEISFVESPSQSDDWTDVTDYLLDRQPVAIQRGRKDEFDQMQAGTATLLLNNDDGRFTADNTSSPYYPYIKPKKRIRISGVYGGVTYPLFTGYVTAWQPEDQIYQDRTVRLDCIDALGAVLGSNNIPSQTLVNAAVISSSSSYDPLTGLTINDNYAPFTQVSCSRSGSSFSGTYTLTFDGETTPPIPVNATLATVIPILEALSTIGPDVIYRGSATSAIFTSSGGGIYFGQRFAGIDVSDRISADFSGVSSPFSFSFNFLARAPAPNPQRSWGRINRRPVRFSISSPPTVGFDAIGVRVRYIDWDQKLITENSNFGFSNTITNYTFANTWDQILGVMVMADTYNAGKTITVAIDNTPASTLSGDQFYAAARAGGMRAADIAGDDGVSLLQTPTLDGQQAISALQTIALSEGGFYFVDTSGVLQFVDRAHRYGGESGGTFGTASDTLPYQVIRYTFDDSYVKNAITITRSGGTAQYVQDIPSVDRYGVKTYEESGLLITSDTEALNKAKFLVNIAKEPRTRINEMQLQGENRSDALWPLLLGAELANTYDIDNATFAGSVALEAIAITANVVPWVVTWTLSPLPTGIFTLDVSLLDGDDLLLY